MGKVEKKAVGAMPSPPKTAFASCGYCMIELVGMCLLLLNTAIHGWRINPRVPFRSISAPCRPLLRG